MNIEELKELELLDIIDLNYTPHTEDADDGCILFEFRILDNKPYYVVADFNFDDKEGDRRDIFYNLPKSINPLIYHKLIRFLSSRYLYRGESWKDAKSCLGIGITKEELYKEYR